MSDVLVDAAVGALAFTLFVAFVVRTRAASGRSRADGFELTYALGWRLAVGALAAVLVAAAVLMHGWGRDVSLAVMLGIDALVLATAVIAADVVFTRYVVTEDGLLRLAVLRPRRLLRWDRVTSVRFRDLWSAALRVESRDGDAMKLSVQLSGWVSLAAAILERVEPRAIDAPTLVILENARGGFLPDVDV